jgi:hypothetical protein
MYLNSAAGQVRQRVESHSLDLIARTVKNDLQSLDSLARVDCLNLELGCIEPRPGESAVPAERPDKKVLEATIPGLHTARQDHPNRVITRRVLRQGLRAGQHHEGTREANDPLHRSTHDNQRSAFQPRLLMIASAAAGCKRGLSCITVHTFRAAGDLVAFFCAQTSER